MFLIKLKIVENVIKAVAKAKNKFKEADGSVSKSLIESANVSADEGFENMRLWPKLKYITEDEFINLLRKSQSGVQFVGFGYFVKGILGGRGYDYQASYQIESKLCGEGKIVVKQYNNGYDRPIATLEIAQ